MPDRTAECACGQLSVRTEGEPSLTVACHCFECQRRTGSSHQLSAWFPDAQIQSISGESQSYTRVGDLGARMDFRFCPRCGTTVFWQSSASPGAHAVAIGCYAEPTFPAPVLEIYGARRHHWMLPITGTSQFDTVPGGVPAGEVESSDPTDR